MSLIIGFSIVVAFIVFNKALQLFKVATTQFIKGEFSRIDPLQIPAAQGEILCAADQFLRANGFSYVHHIQVGPHLKTTDWGLYGVIYYHPATNTWAMGYVEPQRFPIFDWRLKLFTPTQDQRFFVSGSGLEFGQSAYPSRYMIEDSHCYLPQELLEFHFSRLSDNKNSPQLTLDQVDAVFDSLNLGALIEAGYLLKYQQGYRLSAPAARTLVKRWPVLYKEMLAQKQRLLQEGKLDEKNRENTTTLLNQYNQYLALKNRNNTGWVTKTILLVGSVLVFGIFFGLNFSFEYALTVVAVLFVHEAGHLLGMWAFGYKDLKMLFIPFLGALASGKKSSIKTWQEAIILLAGPVPGYALGIYLLHLDAGTQPDWLKSYALVSIILNALNLLPFLPLDGGRLVSLALFNRKPFWQLGLTVLSIGISAIAGFKWSEPAGIVIAIFLSISLPNAVREARLLSHLLAQKIHKHYGRVEQIIESLSGHDIWKKQSPIIRWTLLDSLNYRVQHANTSVLAMIGIFLMWVGAIVLPPLLTVDYSRLAVLASVFGDHDVEPISTESLKEEYAQAQSPVKKMDIGVQLVSLLAYKNKDEANRYWQELKQTVENSEISPEQRGKYFVRFARTCLLMETDCYNHYVMRAVEENRLGNVRSIGAISALSLAANIESVGLDDKLTYLNQALDLAATQKDAGYWRQELSLRKSRILEDRGSIEEAEQILLSLNDDGNNEGDATNPIKLRLIDFYFRQHRIDDAQTYLGRWIGFQKTPSSGIQQDYRYWSVWLMFAQNPSDARTELNLIQTSNSVEKFEIEMAKLYFKSHAGADLQTVDVEALILQSKQVASEEWPELMSHLQMPEVSDYDDEFENELYGIGFAEPWFNELNQFFNKVEFSPIKQAMLASIKAR